jgi:hypothetical protein
MKTLTLFAALAFATTSALAQSGTDGTPWGTKPQPICALYGKC